MPASIADMLGQVTMAYQGAMPWHRLGETMPTNADVPVALKAAHLDDWNVHVQPMFLADGTKIPRKNAVVRGKDRRILATVGGVFDPWQNEEAFGVLQPACEKFGMVIETAGALGRGDRVWMLAKLPMARIEVVPGDAVDGYFLIRHGHNGTTKYIAKPTSVRVVCANTEAMAIGEGINAINIIHTKTTKEQLIVVEEMVEKLLEAMEKTGLTFRQLAQKSLTFEQIEAYIGEVLGIEDLDLVDEAMKARAKKIAELVDHGKGSEFAPRTLWSAFNGITEYFDHVRPIEGRSERSIRAANRSAIFGNNAKTKVKALAIAQRMVSKKSAA